MTHAQKNQPSNVFSNLQQFVCSSLYPTQWKSVSRSFPTRYTTYHKEKITALIQKLCTIAANSRLFNNILVGCPPIARKVTISFVCGGTSYGRTSAPHSHCARRSACRPGAAQYQAG